MATDPKTEAPGPKCALSEKQLAQRRAAGAKARDALKAKNDRPASGYPASYMPAMGPGWGGMAKGPGAGPEALPAARAAPRRSREERGWRKDCWIDWLYALAIDPKTPDGLKISAAVKVLNLIKGPPKPRPPMMMARPPVIMREEEFEIEAPRRLMRGG